jgi:hypothetical protein
MDTQWQVLAYNVVMAEAVGQGFVVQVCRASDRERLCRKAAHLSSALLL